MIKLYCKNAITLNSVVAEFPEVEKELKLLLATKYSFEAVIRAKKVLDFSEFKQKSG